MNRQQFVLKQDVKTLPLFNVLDKIYKVNIEFMNRETSIGEYSFYSNDPVTKKHLKQVLDHIEFSTEKLSDEDKHIASEMMSLLLKLDSYEYKKGSDGEFSFVFSDRGEVKINMNSKPLKHEYLEFKI